MRKRKGIASLALARARQTVEMQYQHWFLLRSASRYYLTGTQT